LEKKIFQLIITRLDGNKIALLEYEEYIFRPVKKYFNENKESAW
jgi:hypothetical protein